MKTILIKRYANRKLYDTEHGRYITLTDIIDYINEGYDIRVVFDGRDITPGVLNRCMGQLNLTADQCKDIIYANS
mgnify:CR=1 FL=1